MDTGGGGGGGGGEFIESFENLYITGYGLPALSMFSRVMLVTVFVYIVTLEVELLRSWNFKCEVKGFYLTDPCEHR